MNQRQSGIAVMVASLPMPAMVLAIVAAAPDPIVTTPPSRYVVAIEVPASSPYLRPASTAPAGPSASEIRCLARAIWHEARGEPLQGQIAVAEVVIARSKDRRWKGDLCHTIQMPRQFSFVRAGRIPVVPQDDAQRMTDLARDVAAGRLSSPAKGSLYYHATYVQPIWRHSLRQSAKIRTHVFYADALPKRTPPI